MLLLPDLILDEIFSHLYEGEYPKLRLISKKWDSLCQPHLFKALDVANQAWPCPSFLTKFGKNLTRAKIQNQLLTEFLKVAEFCPNILTIDYSNLEEKLDIAGLLELSTAFPKLKILTLRGNMEAIEMEPLSPLIAKLDSLQLYPRFDPNFTEITEKKELIDKLKAYHLKHFKFSYLGYGFLDFLAQEMKNVSVLESYCVNTPGPSFTYHCDKSMFQTIRTGYIEDGLHTSITFDLDRIPKWTENYPPSELLRYFTDFLDNFPLAKLESLPPIKKIDCHARNLPAQDTRALLEGLAGVQEFRFDMPVDRDSPPTKNHFPKVRFNAIKVHLDYATNCHLEWISRHFPSIKSLHLHQLDSEATVEVLEFKSLVRLECSYDQPMAFWESLIPACPQLQTVSLGKACSGIDSLRDRFPHVCFARNVKDWAACSSNL